MNEPGNKAMNCSQARIQISALVDRSVSAVQAMVVKEHLESCDSCGRFYREQVEMGRLLGGMALEVEPPERMWLAIESQVGAGNQTFGLDLSRLLTLFEIPSFRQVAVSLVVLVMFSIAFLRLDTSSELNQQVLAELGSYSVAVDGNPFLLRVEAQENPFLPNLAVANPFREYGSPK